MPKEPENELNDEKVDNENEDDKRDNENVNNGLDNEHESNIADELQSPIESLSRASTPQKRGSDLPSTKPSPEDAHTSEARLSSLSSQNVIGLQESQSLPEGIMGKPNSLDNIRGSKREQRKLNLYESLDRKASSKRKLMSTRFDLPQSSTHKTNESDTEVDNVDDGSSRDKFKWKLASISSFKHGLSQQQSKRDITKAKPEAIEEADDGANDVAHDDEEETASQIAAKKLEKHLKQAKKLEKFFVKSDLPPRPLLERTRFESKDWNFDANNDWLGRCANWNFFTLKRPFFAAFHLAWISFFFCFMGWFAIGPLVPLLLKSGFSKEAIETSNALALASTIIIRFILGPLCEEHGAKIVMTLTLAIGGLLVCSTASVTNASGLMASRFFIGLIGGAFVPCQFWITMMFSTKIVGFMSGSAAGFGNAGAGVIVFLMGGLIAGFQGAGYTDDQTWRYSLLIPGFMMILCALPCYLLPSDCPQGKWKDRKYGTPADKIGRMTWLHRGGSAQMQRVLKLERKIARTRWICQRLPLRIRLFFLTEERFKAFWDWKAWMVGIQYSIASGVELSILTGLTAYYAFEFGCQGDPQRQLDIKTRLLNGTLNSTSPENCLALDNSTAAYIAAIFGLTNIYGRMIGGGLSDYIASTKGWFRGVRGRHLTIFITLLVQGIFMMIWSSFFDWQTSAGFLVLFSSVVHMAKGAVIAIAPFVSPGCVGPVMGVVSAVGNLGGVLMSLMYSGFQTSRAVYYWQGLICIIGSLSAFMLKVHDLELNKEVWLLSRPKKPETFEDFDDEVIDNKPKKRKLRTKNTSYFASLRKLKLDTVPAPTQTLERIEESPVRDNFGMENGRIMAELSGEFRDSLSGNLEQPMNDGGLDDIPKPSVFIANINGPSLVAPASNLPLKDHESVHSNNDSNTFTKVDTLNLI